MMSAENKFETGAQSDLESRLHLLLQTGLRLHREKTPASVADSTLAGCMELCPGASGAVFLCDLQSSTGEPITCCRVRGEVPGLLAVRDPLTETAEVLIVPISGSSGTVRGELRLRFAGSSAPHADCRSLLGLMAAQAASALERLQLEATLSEQIALGDALRQRERGAERRLRQALDANLLGTWAWDAASDTIDLDERAAALLGLLPHVPQSRDDLRQHMVLPEDLHRIPEDLGKVLETNGTYAAEYRVRCADGAVRWVASNGIPADDGTGAPTGLIGTVQDITGRRSQEDMLRQSEKLAATGRLAATIAHEINNPLEAVTNLIYLAKTDPSTPTAVSHLLETADEELNRVSHIAQQTLGFYRDTTRPVTIDLNHLLQAVVDLFARKLANKHVRVELDLEADLGMVGLQGEIRQVVSNLLVNAIDASPATGSVIRIRGRHRQHAGHPGISVMFTDAGSGIPEHLKQRLFTPFQTTKQDSGTGLGLWVTRGIVEKHGGHVGFRSRTETPAGTCFRVFLPKGGRPHGKVSGSTEILQ